VVSIGLRSGRSPIQGSLALVRSAAVHATSLNFHDLLVANGGIPTSDGRILMSDGAGVVEAVGEGVTEFKAGIGSFPASSRSGRTDCLGGGRQLRRHTG
jgi:NADPH:quinone reductase-like Zn-dependent oxidoreductase